MSIKAERKRDTANPSAFTSTDAIPNQREQNTLELRPIMVDSDIATPNQLPQSDPIQSYIKRPGGGTRRVLSRFESVPHDGWKMLKKLVGNYRQQAKKLQQQALGSIERQAEINTLGPMILAMHFSRDENNRKRIPVFLSNLSVVVTKDDPFQEPKRTNRFRGTVFKITVQYGTGPGKITWSVYRRYWDFVKLHYRYKKRYANAINSNRDGSKNSLIGSRTRPPKFPSIPRRHFRRRKDNQPIALHTNGTAAGSITDLSSSETNPHTRSESLMDEDAVMTFMTRSQSATDAGVIDEGTASASRDPSIASSQVMEVVKADRSVLLAMENYLNQFINSIEPCGYVNRLCKFLEISALGLQLASRYPNSSHHGKEGFAVFQSRTDRDPKQKRQFFQDVLMCSLPTTGGKRRRKPKWFVVRESYVLCVNDPSETEIYDVFLFDQMFDIHRLVLFRDKPGHRAKNNKKKLSNALENASHWASGKSTLCLKNMQGVYHFRAKNEQQAKQFEKSIQIMAQKSLWCKENRFGSFAPIRINTPVAWFVDARDYFWDMSVALENARECIYIHDWWLSPELFLRRPAARNLEWRLDRLLRRKAEQGVKVYIVMYKEVAMALPLFSHQAKRHLLSLSNNIYVQRHPSRALDIFNKDSIFFWAHHEKICVVDNEVAFIGGIDLCFGRYDTADHILPDDRDPQLHTMTEKPQIWPGKDFSNPRIIDFHTLDKPFEDNMDRKTLPRMPWHDVSMRILGPAARDVSRHFIQRWNFLRRKKPSAPKRPTPMLVPVPDDYNNVIGMDDPRICHPNSSESCRVQILRSVSPWSIGSTDHVEHSIQTAYVESIKNSNYFVYIENQFFVTSTKSGATVIENKIGEALYERILRAHREDKKWRAIIIVPLVPGFPANIDETEATTVRLIMECQYLSIARGPDSILARLHAQGVTNTHEYINFYGLRNWGELNGQYVTEQVYIHAKTMIVDDRTVIIGSANINERSQLGTRDSEIAACIQDDKDLINSRFNGKKVKVGRYAHTLRMRLMCEHIGLDTDRIDRERYGDKTSNYFKQSLWADRVLGDDDKNDAANCLPPYIQVTTGSNTNVKEKDRIQQEEKDQPFIEEASRYNTRVSSDSSSDTSRSNYLKVNDKRNRINEKKRTRVKRKIVFHHKKNQLQQQANDSQEAGKRAAAANVASGHQQLSQTQPLEPVKSTETQDTTHSTSTSALSPSKSLFNKRKSAKEDYFEFWTQLDPDTDNNGDIKAWTERLSMSETKADATTSPSISKNQPPQFSDYYSSAKLEPPNSKNQTVGDIYKLLQDPLTQEFQDFWHMLARFNTDLFRRSFLVTPDNNVRNWEQYEQFSKMAKLFLGRTDVKHGGTKTTAAAANVTTLPLNGANGGENTIREIIKHIRGHLVIWPNHFMEEGDEHNEFLFNVDKFVPLEIFD